MKNTVDAAAVRDVFSANLKLLIQDTTSVSALCRQLGINRTQFLRYLSGESYPRPDTLKLICDFFDVDARILLEPLKSLRSNALDVLNHPAVRDFNSVTLSPAPRDMLPLGFYRFSRRSFLFPERYLTGVVYVFREDGLTIIKGFEVRHVMKEQGIPFDAKSREFRGYVQQQEAGFVSMIYRRGGMTGTFNYLAPVPSIEQTFWVGFSARTVPEALGSARITRMVYEYLGTSTEKALPAARHSGLRSESELPAFHKRLLKPDLPFQ